MKCLSLGTALALSLIGSAQAGTFSPGDPLICGGNASRECVVNPNYTKEVFLPKYSMAWSDNGDMLVATFWAYGKYVTVCNITLTNCGSYKHQSIEEFTKGHSPQSRKTIDWIINLADESDYVVVESKDWDK